MTMKVTEHKGGKTRTTTTLDLTQDLENVNRATKTRIKNNVGDFVVDKILEKVAGQESPVSGESWPGLKDTPYRQKKRQLAGNTRANMELNGDMLNALQSKNIPNGVEVGFFDEEANKADGHNRFSGRRAKGLPRRRFLPATGQTFDQDIRDGIAEIIVDTIGEQAILKQKDLRGIQNKTQLFGRLGSLFPSLNRPQIVSLITRNPKAQDTLLALDLLRFL